jgi:hypothetical protein
VPLEDDGYPDGRVWCHHHRQQNPHHHHHRRRCSCCCRYHHAKMWGGLQCSLKVNLLVGAPRSRVVERVANARNRHTAARAKLRWERWRRLVRNVECTHTGVVVYDVTGHSACTKLRWERWRGFVRVVVCKARGRVVQWATCVCVCMCVCVCVCVCVCACACVCVCACVIIVTVGHLASSCMRQRSILNERQKQTKIVI